MAELRPTPTVEKTVSRVKVILEDPPVSWEVILGWTLVSPIIVIYVLAAIAPIIFSLFVSVHEIPLGSTDWIYVGAENYLSLFQEPEFWHSLRRGIVYMGGSTLLQLFVGVWIALVINSLTKAKNRWVRILSTLVFAAYLIPTIIITLVAMFMMDPFVGVLHQAVAATGLWDPNRYLLGNTDLAMPIVILVGSWKYSIFITIFTIAQLRSIPETFYEAAMIDGATRWEMFRDITLPRIKGAILVAVFLRSIFMFNKFDLIWQLTQGGPGTATTTVPIFAFQQVFMRSSYGTGNAIAIIMFSTLAAGGLLYFRFFNPSEEVETEL